MKKRWYLLLIAAGLLLCASRSNPPSISPSPSLLCWLRVGPYWWAVPSAPCCVRSFGFATRYSFRLTKNSTTSGTP